MEGQNQRSLAEIATEKDVARINAPLDQEDLAELGNEALEELFNVFQAEMRQRGLLKEEALVGDLGHPGPDAECKKKCDRTRCEKKKGVFDLRSKSLTSNYLSKCVLKPEFRPDEELTAKMCYLSAYVIRKSNKFKHQGMLNQFLKLKNYMLAMDEPKLSLMRTSNKTKPKLAALMKAYESQEVKRYKDTLEQMCVQSQPYKETLPEDLQITKERTQGHYTYHFQFWKRKTPIKFYGDAWSMKPHELVMENINRGIRKSWSMKPMHWIFKRAFGKDFSMGELIQVATPVYEAKSIDDKIAHITRAAPKLAKYKAFLRERLQTAENDAQAAKDACRTADDPDLCFQKKFKEVLNQQPSVRPTDDQLQKFDRELAGSNLTKNLFDEAMQGTIGRDMEEISKDESGDTEATSASLMEVRAEMQSITEMQSKGLWGWSALTIILAFTNFFVMVGVCGPLVITGPAGSACWGAMISMQVVLNLAAGFLTQMAHEQDKNKVKPLTSKAWNYHTNYY